MCPKSSKKEDRFKILRELKAEDRKDVYDFAMKRSDEINKGIDPLEDLTPEQRLLHDQCVRSFREAMKPFLSDDPHRDMEKTREACCRALKRLGDSVPKYREMVPAFEIECDYETGEMICTFYMDVPYVEARVTLHRPGDKTDEEWEKLVDEIVADMTPELPDTSVPPPKPKRPKGRFIKEKDLKKGRGAIEES